MRWTTERQLKRWKQEGLLTEEKVAELRESLVRGESAGGIRIFAVIGAVLVGLGVILFVSSNWAGMGPASRISVLLAGFAVVVVGAVAAGRRDQPRVAEAMWLLATLVFGANIFLIAQIFNQTLTYWQGTFRWMLGALVLGWALKSKLQAAVAIPLGLLTLGWIGNSSWLFDQQMEFLFSAGGLRPILPLIGVGLVSLSLLSARSKNWAFVRDSCFRWGLLLIAVPVVISTAGDSVAEWFYGIDGTVKQFTILAAVAVLLAAALVYGEFRSRISRPVLGATAAFLALMLVPVAGKPWVAAEIGGLHLPFAGYVLVVFALALVTIWTGVRASNRRLLNVGMFSSAVLIFIQYYSWSFAMLDRSLAFILGGLVLLGLTVLLEKKRRALLQKMTPVKGEEP
ncbi:MAG: DUF2157 domain-containing protein [Thermoanaerobaculia bacterium]